MTVAQRIIQTILFYSFSSFSSIELLLYRTWALLWSGRKGEYVLPKDVNGRTPQAKASASSTTQAFGSKSSVISSFSEGYGHLTTPKDKGNAPFVSTPGPSSGNVYVLGGQPFPPPDATRHGHSYYQVGGFPS